MSEAASLLARVKKNWDTNYWYEKKHYALEIIALAERLGYAEPSPSATPGWMRANQQRYPFSLPHLARFVADRADETLAELYQHVSRTYAGSMYNISNDTIQTVIEYHLAEPGGLPDVFWDGFVRDVDVQVLARLGKLLPQAYVGSVLTDLFALEADKSWGEPYLNLFHLYLTQRTDGYGELTWDYLEMLYKPHPDSTR